MSVKPSIYEKFIIESADGERTVDISRGVTAFFYYENIFSPYLTARTVSYTHLRAHETPEHLVCPLML